MAVKLLAEKVDSAEQAAYCQLSAFGKLFQGYYFARPSVLSAKRADPGQMALIGFGAGNEGCRHQQIEQFSSSIPI